MKNKTLLTIGLFLFVVFIGFSYTMFVIYSDVKTHCIKAQQKYNENCVDSLIITLQSDNTSYRDKNNAIWTLGQIADKKALPILESMYTENIPKKESYDKEISQYELQKAIKWCKKGNVTSWMYKSTFLQN